MRNKHAVNVQEMQDTIEQIMGASKRLSKNRGEIVVRVDNDFGENQHADRHGGRMGTKHMHRHMKSETIDDPMREIVLK